MNVWATAYHCTRIVTWLLWASVVGYSIYFMVDRAPHLGQLGLLSHRTEAFMFGLPMAAVVAGLMQLMFREKAYRPRD